MIVNRKGRVVGWVTSCSINSEGRLVGLGFVQEPQPRARHAAGRLPGGQGLLGDAAAGGLNFGDRIMLPEDITVLPRFLNKQ